MAWQRTWQSTEGKLSTWHDMTASSRGGLDKDIRKACGRGNTKHSHTWRKVDSLDMWRKDKVQLRGLKGNKYTSPHNFAQVSIICVIMNRYAKCSCMEEDNAKQRWGKMDLISENIWFSDTNFSIHTIEYWIFCGISVLIWAVWKFIMFPSESFLNKQPPYISLFKAK